ncbi:MAG TPA: hypothetical protein VIW29_11405 [Polyangiaceae bacterium]
MMRAVLWALGAALFTLLLPALSVAAPASRTLQAPVGGAAIPVGAGSVVCGVSGGWVLEGNGTQVRPPSSDDAAGNHVLVKTAPSWTACGQTKEQLTLLATARFPVLEAASVVFYVDEGRVEARGRSLRGAQLRWLGSGRSGTDTCVEPKTEGAVQSCSWAVGRDLSADPTADVLRILPAFAELGEGRQLFDAQGQALPVDGVALVAGRIVLGRLLAADTQIDLSQGRTELALLHPEAVAGADCGVLECQLVGKKLLVTSTAPVSVAEVKLRLAPRVVLQRRAALDPTPSFKLQVLHCTMTLVSGEPVRRNDAAKLVVKLERRCLVASDSYRFSIGDRPLRLLGSAQTEAGLFAVLELGAYAQEKLEITARHRDTEAVLAVLSTPTRDLEPVRARLSLPEYPRIDFIPTNRPAQVRASRLTGPEHWELVSVPNVYTAHRGAERVSVMGEPDAEGFVQLQFALRSEQLPAELGQVDLALVADPIQRRIREANVPVALDGGKEPLVEFKCGPPGKVVMLAPGDPINLPFGWRDTCRLTVHRERLKRENGRQRLNLSIDVFTADGATRSEGHVKDTLDVGPGSAPREVWIQGVLSSFDRIVVRLAHDADEAHYVEGSKLFASGPAVQWSVILGTGNVRLYATSTIPAGLYRFGDADHSGVLSLNFGVISRLTWLTDEGREGLIGLEAGVMVFGVGSSTSTTGHDLTQVGIPVGLGLSIPIANRLQPTEAAINLHGWVEFPISGDSHKPAFIFGPSISIGNIGANL